ncbi:MAG: NfeD family protein [Prolixibacteraceae bacterium]|nr:NfeD family protein [Prolixibacteraceae bacterium]
MEFEVWHIWLIASIVFFILEIFLPSFVVINFGVGALFATIIAGMGGTIQWQVVVFSVTSLASFFLIRPALKKWAYRRSDKVETNMNALVGRKGVVSETIDPDKNTGRILIDGDDWKARSLDGSIIEKNKKVTVTKVDSIVMEVKET